MNKLFITLLALVLLSFSLVYTNSTQPKGDEVHYLIVASSIIKDHDIWLENNYPVGLDRHTVQGAGGHEYLYHGLGIFPFLISPGFLVLGRVGAVLTNVGLSILLIIQIFLFTKEVTKSSRISFFTTSAFAISLPLANYYVLIFPEITAGLLILTSLRYYFFKSYPKILIFLLIGLLPWVHIRFFPVALALFFLWFLKLWPGERYKSSTAATASAVLFIGYFIFLWVVYGSFNPTAPYKQLNIDIATGNFFANIVNVLVDRQYGLFTHTPLFILTIPGFFVWFKVNRKQALIILAILFLYSIPVFKYSDWHGGFAPPARYLTALVPLLIPAVALFIKFTKGFVMSTLIFFSFGWGIFAFLANLLNSPNYGFVYKDGNAPYLIYLNSLMGLNVQSLFPAYYPEGRLGPLSIIWFFMVIIFARALYALKRKL